MSLHFVRLAISACITLSEQQLENYTPVSAQLVGEALAEQADLYCQQQQLGYYPALDYLQKSGAVEEELLEAVVNLNWLTTQLVRDEVRRQLRPYFSRVQVLDVHALALTMPTVRIRNPNALYELATHYSPNRLRIDLELTLLRKSPDSRGVENFAKRAVVEHLQQRFAQLEVTSCLLLNRA